MFILTSTWECCRYWDLGDKQIANNSRAGSVSVYFAITNSGIRFTGVSEPTKAVFMLVRDPVERFISVRCKGEIHPGTGNHFELQSKLAVGPEVHLYRFPEQLRQFGEDTGLGEIPWVNKSTSQPPQITEAEREQVLLDYAPDVELFESLRGPSPIVKSRLSPESRPATRLGKSLSLWGSAKRR